MRSQGLTLADLNREYVQQSQQLEQLQSVLSDANLRNQFFAEYDRALGGNRPTFPGQSPDVHVPHSASDLEFWFGRMDELVRRGFQFGPQQLQTAAAWDEIPDEVFRNGIDYLIRI